MQLVILRAQHQKPALRAPAPPTPCIHRRRGGGERTEANLERLVAGGLHLYLLEEGSRFALDNWLQQRASPLAGGGSLRQVWTRWLHCEPLSLALQASASSDSLGFITDFERYTLTCPHKQFQENQRQTKLSSEVVLHFRAHRPKPRRPQESKNSPRAG